MVVNIMKGVIAVACIISFIVILFVPHMTLEKVACIQDITQEDL